MTAAKRSRRGRRTSGNTEAGADALAYLRGERPSCWWSLLSDGSAADLRRLWDTVGADLVEKWARERPGARPAGWWLYEALGPRERLGGVGTTIASARGLPDVLAFGIPQYWATELHVTFLGAGVAFCPVNPPTFEAQATYLRRHKLLLPGEAKRLRPADFEPEGASLETPWLPPLPPRPPAEEEHARLRQLDPGLSRLD